MLHQFGQHNRAQGHDRADREVNTTGQDDEGHAHRHDDQKGVVDQQVQKHLGREEAGVGHAAEHRHGREQRHRAHQRDVFAFQFHALLAACGRTTQPRTAWRNSADCISMTTNTTAALTTRLISGGTPIE